MAGRKWSILVAFFILLISMEAAIAQAQGGNGNGNGNGNGDEKGNGEGKDKEKGKEKEKKPKKNKPRDESSDYDKLETLPSGQERGFCTANTSCHFKTLVCPEECKKRKPKKNKKEKGCFIDCSSKCEATCKCKFTSIYFPLYLYRSKLSPPLMLLHFIVLLIYTIHVLS